MPKLKPSFRFKHPSRMVRLVAYGILTVIGCMVSTAYGATSSSIANGKNIYDTICSACHGPSAADNVHGIAAGASNPSLIESLINVNFGGMGILQSQFHLTSTQIGDAANYLGSVFFPNQGDPGIASNPLSIVFSSQVVGSSGPGSTLTVSNIGTGTLIISGITASSSDFGVFSGCGANLAPAQNCFITVTFKPKSVGTIVGAMNIQTNASSESYRIALSGVGTSPTPVSGPDNYSDSWWNADESGWGITITDHDANAFVQWYAYDQSGRNQKYVISGGTFANGKCQFSGTLQHVTGPSWTLSAFDPAQVSRTTAGFASIDFCPSDVALGTIVFNYTADGVTGSKQLTRLPFGDDVSHWNGATNKGAVDFTDLWWNPAESGWGVAITQHGNNAFVRIFVYDVDSRPLLFVVPGVTFTSPTNFTGALQLTTGPWFGQSPFDPAQVTRTTAGSATLTFSDANNGVLSYTVNGITKTKSITRLAF